MKHFLFVSFLLFLKLGSAFSQSLTKRIAAAYGRFEKDEQLEYALSSLTVLNAETGEVVFSRNAEYGLSPASTLKVVTSATAFHLLGEGFKWKTTIGYTGTITKEGVLNGDLILAGQGDPTFGSSRYNHTNSVLSRLTEAVRKSGIRQVNGRVIADDHLFGTQTLPLGWIWQDIGNYYGAGIPSLCWNENQFDLIFEPGDKVGDPARLLRTEPEMPYLQIVNEVKTGDPGSGDNVYAYSAPYSDVVYLRGTYGIDLRKKVAASVPDPAFEAAFRLNKALTEAGIRIEKSPVTHRQLSLQHRQLPTVYTTLAEFNSPSFPDVIYWFNRKSINLYGEAILKTLALNNGKNPTTEEGTELLKDFWNKKAGIDKRTLNVIDGSGLSPENRVSTATIARILQSARREPWYNSFYASLPEYNGMKMKSGSMRNVQAYAGFHTNSAGISLAFSFIVNNYNGKGSALRQKMFQVLDQLK